MVLLRLPVLGQVFFAFKIRRAVSLERRMDCSDDIGTVPKRKQSFGEEIANSISHGVGFIAALIATPILLLAAVGHHNSGFFVGTVVFALTILALYLGSTLYHAWPHTRGKGVLQLFDHCAIFLLIAGTYTP